MKQTLLALFACAICSQTPGAHAADNYPSRPIHLIVPFSAGGIGDTIARIVSAPLSDQLGEPIIVENRPGGDGLVGTQYAGRSDPDGYTVLQVSTPLTINMVMRAKPRYDLTRDFEPVACAVRSTLVLVVPASAPSHSVADLVAYAKTKPQGLSFGSGAVGSVGHLSGELFSQAAGIHTLHIPYKGESAVVPDLVSGRLDFSFASQPEAIQGVAAGQMRALAVSSLQRVSTFPDLPTMTEAGFKGFDPSSNYGYMVPANTPLAVAKKLNEAITKVISQPAVQERFRLLGLTPNACAPDGWSSIVKREIARWGPVVKAANVHAD
ncbi:Bug family tripartite tricarboxylate transporter substrate binding protein [Paraburkholderia sp. HD33-4]|uniref:Bug family tripartite tricarboxylate transporter substrate binding protein n=1 Tax=Paraburkholderia sp. HD33-4 TaxID=2883242 RepID=UPI001F22FE01|nr:tripartite tricarboxylate transporter substrate binding protein [Paraburkholderia sp. HD33-4]